MKHHHSALCRYVFFSFIVLLLSACGEKEEGLGRYGMMDENTPDYAALAFMKSIYEGDDISRAVELSSDSMARMLKRYRTNRNVQRYIVNLRYDTVTITPQSGNGVGRSEYAESAEVTLFFSGMFGDDKVEDLRTINMIRDDGQWKVDRIAPDHFM